MSFLPRRFLMISERPLKRAAADEQDVRRVHLDVLLLGVLAAALGGDVGDRPLEHLQQGLLHALAADVAGDGDILGGLADLVDLVDVDDAPSRPTPGS